MTGSIAFDADGPDGHHVWVVDDGGVGPARNLTGGVNARSSLPTWSPDGRQIAFVRYYPNADNSQIWVMNADGSNQHQLTGGAPDYEGGAHDYPAWSPVLHEPFPRLLVGLETYAWPVIRGINRLLALFGQRPRGIEVTKVAYMHITGRYTIATINADGTNQRDIFGYYPDRIGDGWAPAWSPDGTKIAFTRVVSDVDPFDFRIAVMNADGTGVTDFPVGGPYGFVDSSSAWSPDGTKIAFDGNRSGTNQVWLMNANGTGLVRLTNSVGNDRSPAWSPDGTKLAIASDRGGSLSIWTMDANGGGFNNVTLGLQEHSCNNPSWSTSPPPPTLTPV
jgi:TolB protein